MMRKLLGLMLLLVGFTMLSSTTTGCDTLCASLGQPSGCFDDLFDTSNQNGDDDGDDNGDDEDDGDGDDQNDDDDQTTGDAQAGAVLFADNCAACHGEDGSGNNIGPNIRGKSASEIQEKIAEGGVHAGVQDLTQNEIEDIAAFLNQ